MTTSIAAVPCDGHSSAIAPRAANEHRSNPSRAHRSYSERVDCVAGSISRAMASARPASASSVSIDCSDPWRCVRDRSRSDLFARGHDPSPSPWTCRTSCEIPWLILPRTEMTTNSTKRTSSYAYLAVGHRDSMLYQNRIVLVRTAKGSSCHWSSSSSAIRCRRRNRPLEAWSWPCR